MMKNNCREIEMTVFDDSCLSNETPNWQRPDVIAMNHPEIQKCIETLDDFLCEIQILKSFLN